MSSFADILSSGFQVSIFLMKLENCSLSSPVSVHAVRDWLSGRGWDFSTCLEFESHEFIIFRSNRGFWKWILNTPILVSNAILRVRQEFRWRGTKDCNRLCKIFSIIVLFIFISPWKYEDFQKGFRPGCLSLWYWGKERCLLKRVTHCHSNIPNINWWAPFHT